MNDTPHSKTLSQITLHVNFTYESHKVCHSLLISFQQLYSNHYKLYDIIELWLEESYMSSFPMNNHTAKFDMLSRYFLESILPIFHASVLQSLQLAFNKHGIAGLELLDWLHWHYTHT